MKRHYLTDDPRYRRLVWLVRFAQEDLRTQDEAGQSRLRDEAAAFCLDPRAWAAPENPVGPWTPPAGDQDTVGTLSERKLRTWQEELKAVLDELLDPGVDPLGRLPGFPLHVVRLPAVTYTPYVSRIAVSRGGAGTLWSDVARTYRSATAGWWAGVAEVLGWGASRLRRCAAPACSRVFVARHPTAQGCCPTHARQLTNRKDYERRTGEKATRATRAKAVAPRRTRRT